MNKPTQFSQVAAPLLLFRHWIEAKVKKNELGFYALILKAFAKIVKIEVRTEFITSGYKLILRDQFPTIESVAIKFDMDNYLYKGTGAIIVTFRDNQEKIVVPIQSKG